MSNNKLEAFWLRWHGRIFTKEAWNELAEMAEWSGQTGSLRELIAKWRKQMEALTACETYYGNTCGDWQARGRFETLKSNSNELEAVLAASTPPSSNIGADLAFIQRHGSTPTQLAASELRQAELDEGAPTNTAYRIWNDLIPFISFIGTVETKYKAIAVIQGHIVEMLNSERSVHILAQPVRAKREEHK